MGRGIRKQGAASIFAGGFFRFAVYACVVCAVIYVGKSAYDFGYAIFDQIPVDDEDHGEDVTVVIKDGASVYQIGKILKSKGLIKDAKHQQEEEVAAFTKVEEKVKKAMEVFTKMEAAGQDVIQKEKGRRTRHRFFKKNVNSRCFRFQKRVQR